MGTVRTIHTPMNRGLSNCRMLNYVMKYYVTVKKNKVLLKSQRKGYPRNGILDT